MYSEMAIQGMPKPDEVQARVLIESESIAMENTFTVNMNLL